MDLANILGIVIALMTVGGAVLGMPWLIQRKIAEAIDERTKHFVTELHLLKEFREYVARKEFEVHVSKIERELRWQRRVMVAIASKMDLHVDPTPEGE